MLYAVCILAPHSALAIGQLATHCAAKSEASHVHQANGADHAHAGAPDHHHADAPLTAAGPEGEGHAGMCCGVFCLTGLTAPPAVTLAVPGGTGRVAADVDRSMDGRGADRIIRPPKA